MPTPTPATATLSAKDARAEVERLTAELASAVAAEATTAAVAGALRAERDAALVDASSVAQTLADTLTEAEGLRAELSSALAHAGDCEKEAVELRAELEELRDATVAAPTAPSEVVPYPVGAYYVSGRASNGDLALVVRAGEGDEWVLAWQVRGVERRSQVWTLAECIALAGCLRK